MGFAFNPFTGNFDLKGSGGGGDAAPFAGQVDAYADLPLDSTAALNSRWLVKNNSGTWPFSTYKQAGIYIRVSTVGASRDTDYQFVGTLPSVMNDNEFLIYDDTDATKNLKFNVGANVPTASTVTLTAPSASGTISRTEDFAAPPAIGNTTPAAGTFTTLTANNGTLTASAPVLDLAQTWNAGGTTFTALRVSVTNTNSASASRLADFQTGGVSMFSIERFGSVSVASNLTVGATVIVANAYLASSQLKFNNAGTIDWASSSNKFAGEDLTLARDAADILAQRRTTNPQTFRLYTTIGGTGNVDFERLFIKGQTGGAFQIGTEKGGTGLARALEFHTDGTRRAFISDTGSFGIGLQNVADVSRPFHLSGSIMWGRMDRTGTNGPAWMMVRQASYGTNTSVWLFGPHNAAGASNDDFAITDYGVAVTGTSGTTRLTIAKSDGQLTVNGNLNLSTKDLVTDTTTGTKIGTATSQKIGFFNATPVVQQAAIADATDAATTQARLNDLLATMRAFGLIAT
jgi:hypothetical protein